ncbi:unnamed protein product [Wickerhamomyces anomalus]
MHRYNESVLHKWTNNAERELYLNGNNHDLNDSRLFDYNEELNNAVEGERQDRVNEGEEDEEDDDDDSRTLRLNSEESGNEDEYIKKPNRRINFELNDAMGTDIKSKRSFSDGYDLNTSLTTILSREKQHSTENR